MPARLAARPPHSSHRCGQRSPSLAPVQFGPVCPICGCHQHPESMLPAQALKETHAPKEGGQEGGSFWSFDVASISPRRRFAKSRVGTNLTSKLNLKASQAQVPGTNCSGRAPQNHNRAAQQAGDKAAVKIKLATSSCAISVGFLKGVLQLCWRAQTDLRPDSSHLPNEPSQSPKGPRNARLTFLDHD